MNDPDDKNVKIPNATHQLLGVLKALEMREMRDIAAQAIEEYAERHRPDARELVDANGG